MVLDMSMTHDAPSTAEAQTVASLPPPALRIDDALIDAVAAEADADPRSVVRRIAGLDVKGRAGRRIDTVLMRRGLARGPTED